MNTTLLTSSQTLGPFFAPALLRHDAVRQVLVQPETVGERIRIEGHVLDGDRLPIPDALVEIWQAPHICVTVFSRGLLNHLVTRLYFADEPTNASDPVLLHVPEHRRATLIAQRQPEGPTLDYRFDIIMQGTCETVFFNV